jgi:hypothetical protein
MVESTQNDPVIVAKLLVFVTVTVLLRTYAYCEGIVITIVCPGDN